MGLLQLPVEVIEMILLNLDFKSILSCKRVNQLLRRIFQGSVFLRYLVECEFAGVHDNPYCSLPTKTRLKMLRDREHAWSTLQPAFRERTYGPPDTEVESVDITGGHFQAAVTDPTPDSFSWIWSCIIPTTKQIPVNLEGCETQWSKFVVQGCVDFATCIEEHDLLAFLTVHPGTTQDTHELRLALIQNSTRMPHPLAAAPTFRLADIICAPEELMTRMDICGDIIAIAIEENLTLYLVDWKVGRVKFMLPLIESCDLTFLRHDILCLACPLPPSLEIVYIPDFDCHPARHIQTFFIPEEFFPEECTWVEARGCPNPTSRGSFPRYIPPSRPFIEKAEDAVVIFDFHWSSSASPVSMLVHRRSLIQLLPPVHQWSNDIPRITHWMSWGPKHTRWFNCAGNDDCFTTISYGQRYIHYLTRKAPCHYTVVDLNPHRIRSLTPASRVETDLYHDNVTLQMRGSLPFATKSSTDNVSYTMVFASDTGIVGLNGIDNGPNTFHLTSLDHYYFG